MPPVPTTTGPEIKGFPRIGDVVAGKYEVERILGVGGMGIVVAARHKQLDELVAIKLLHPDSAMDGEAVARLLREARATISIKSEHVVRVHDVGTLDSGSPYILMEYLTGVDLGELVRTNGYLTITDAVDYVLQAGEAIAEAHARGIVHRDLKPSNLFLSRRPDGSALVKVLDFGISKALITEEAGGAAAQISLTATKAVFGSPMYMSPEQVRSAKRVDERTDIWALGVILHELLTGASPFSGETMPGVLASISADQPEPLRRRRPDAPVEMETIIACALIKDPNERTQSVLALGRMLEPFASPDGKLSIERIQRLSMPGGVSKRSLPQRFSSAPPSNPSAPMALGSTVRATTAGITQNTRRSPLLIPLAIITALSIAFAAWTLRSSYNRNAPTVATSPHVAEPPPPAAAMQPTSPYPSAQAGVPVVPRPQAEPESPSSLPSAAPRAAPAPGMRPPRPTHATPSPSASSSHSPAQPTIDDPLNGR
jgi:eukaryotic-like serine/threonine-protein kinase